jgi:hypothetical protein
MTQKCNIADLGFILLMLGIIFGPYIIGLILCWVFDEMIGFWIFLSALVIAIVIFLRELIRLKSLRAGTK